MQRDQWIRVTQNCYINYEYLVKVTKVFVKSKKKRSL